MPATIDSITTERALPVGLRRAERGDEDKPREWWIHWILRIAAASTFIGHGAFGIRGKEGGVGDAATLNDVAGLFEIGLGALLLLSRAATTPVLLFVVAWKLGTESLYITDGVAGAGWEVIERGGSYAAPLALICLNAIVRRPGPRRNPGACADQPPAADRVRRGAPGQRRPEPRPV